MVTEIDLEKIYAELDEKMRKSFHPFNCPNCGRIIKITSASVFSYTGYAETVGWYVHGICSKCGQVSEGG